MLRMFCKFSYLCALSLLIGVYVATAKVLRYRETVMYSTDKQSSWDKYDESANKMGIRMHVSNVDDGPMFDRLGMCIPYFQLENTEVYISPDGFLAFQSVNPCMDRFCGENSKVHFSFNREFPTRGDYPLIGLYVTDLNPSSRQESSIYRVIMNKTYNEESFQVAIVEYKNVFSYASRHRPGEESLTGQIEIWKNGTIIFRFKSIPNIGLGIAGTGILWTKSQRYVAPDVVYNELSQVNIRAIRYDPEEDVCSIADTCADCPLKGCSWCDSSQECVSTYLVVDICPSPTTQNSCRMDNLSIAISENIANGGDGVVPQAFYRAKITHKMSFYDIRNDGSHEEISIDETNVSLNFKAPFFYSSPVMVPSTNPQFVSKFTIRRDGTWSMVGEQDCAKDPDFDVCIDGKYKFVIAPYAVQLYNNPDTTRQILRLGERPPGSIFCQRHLVENCTPAIVVQYTDYLIASETVSVIFQVLLDADGNIDLYYIETSNSLSNIDTIFDITCNSVSIWKQYPNPVIGVIFDGLNDKSSVIFPWSVILDKTQISLSLIPGCNNCHRGGSCNYSSRKCVCAHNYGGENCDVCARGFFGPLCKPCDKCMHGGICDDGKKGSGYCICPPPYSGRNCDKICNSRDERLCTPKCKYGYCDCGKCVCNTTFGYYGPDCSNWFDPCNKYTLDGCEVCVLSKNPKCNFCKSENRCLSDSDQEYVIGNINKCTSVPLVTFQQSSLCRQNPQTYPPDSTFAIVTVISVFSTLGLCSCVTLAAICMCRKSFPNILVVHAVPGVANFTFPSREREIVRLTRLPVQGAGGKSVQGIPLKQLQMKQLVKIQREARRTGIPICELYSAEH